MKNVILSLAALAVVISAPSFATAKKVTTTTTTRTVNEDTSTPGHGSFWLGVTTDNFATGTTNPGLSALIGFNDKVALQLYAAIDGTTPKFGFGVGGNVKVNVVGNWNKGFHLGGGFGLGSTVAAATFYAQIYGLLGLHWQPVDGVMVIADGGLGITIVSGATTFRMGTPGVAGLSLLFRI